MVKLSRDFYSRDTLIVARELLGKVIVHDKEGVITSGKIVEVEAYLGIIDKAAHSYKGRKTDRVMAMYGIPGTSYIFSIYGMHNCFNVVTKEEGVPEAVLIRGIEPLEGLDTMSMRRFNKPYESLSKRETYNITNGPSKLCSALLINKSNNKQDLLGDELYLEEGNNEDFTIESSKRIGIDYAEEARDYPWRYFIKGNPYVSK